VFPLPKSGTTGNRLTIALSSPKKGATPAEHYTRAQDCRGRKGTAHIFFPVGPGAYVGRWGVSFRCNSGNVDQVLYSPGHCGLGDFACASHMHIPEGFCAGFDIKPDAIDHRARTLECKFQRARVTQVNPNQAGFIFPVVIRMSGFFRKTSRDASGETMAPQFSDNSCAKKSGAAKDNCFSVEACRGHAFFPCKQSNLKPAAGIYFATAIIAIKDEVFTRSYEDLSCRMARHFTDRLLLILFSAAKHSG
jgi:hypothetical protein